MDFRPIATPKSLVTGKVCIHACIHYALQSFMVHA
jgi:hypothetical protein